MAIAVLAQDQLVPVSLVTKVQSVSFPRIDRDKCEIILEFQSLKLEPRLLGHKLT